MPHVYKRADAGRGGGTPESITQSFTLFLVKNGVLQGEIFHEHYDADKPYDPKKTAGFLEKEVEKRLRAGGMVDPVKSH